MRNALPSDSSAHRVGLFNFGSNYRQESLVRVVNPGDGVASVSVRGVDGRDVAAPGGVVRFSIPPRSVRTLSAAALEDGAAGLSGALGEGAGKWGLAVEADAPIQAMGLVAAQTAHPVNTDDEAADRPPAPRLQLTGARSFTVNWSHTGQAGETDAFDIGVRLGRSGGWTQACHAATNASDGEQRLSVQFAASRRLPIGTVIQGRYRYRNGSSCSGGTPDFWSHIGEATVPDPEEEGNGIGSASGPPDLVVEMPSLDKGRYRSGEPLTLSATVRNLGSGRSGLTTLRYYRSADSTISTADVEVGMDGVEPLEASATSPESITIKAPFVPVVYYYGACADWVTGESSESNNCSIGVRGRGNGRVLGRSHLRSWGRMLGSGS